MDMVPFMDITNVGMALNGNLDGGHKCELYLYSSLIPLPGITISAPNTKPLFVGNAHPANLAGLRT